jgi:hypothetical protein
MESILRVPLAGTIEAVVESEFYYTDADSQAAEDFVADIALITLATALHASHRSSLG